MRMLLNLVILKEARANRVFGLIMRRRISQGSLLVNGSIAHALTNLVFFFKRDLIAQSFDVNKYFAEGEDGIKDFRQYYRRLDYSNRPVWILPINRTEPSPHWILTVVDTNLCKISYFDSLACKSTWKEDVQVNLFSH
jgi:hypothetical protein